MERMRVGRLSLMIIAWLVLLSSVPDGCVLISLVAYVRGNNDDQMTIMEVTMTSMW